VSRLKLVNVRFIADNIQTFEENFDIGISLHACGVATDIAIRKSVKARAMYVSIPCCVGKIAHHDSLRSERTSCGRITYPRSQEYKTLGCSLPEYLHVAKAADFGHHGYDDTSSSRTCDHKESSEHKDCADMRGGEASAGKIEALTEARRLSKRLIEQDRNFYARGEDFTTYMSLCHPISCTPKNDIIIGIPNERQTVVTTFDDWTRIVL
jgi:hypothetical protein